MRVSIKKHLKTNYLPFFDVFCLARLWSREGGGEREEQKVGIVTTTRFKLRSRRAHFLNFALSSTLADGKMLSHHQPLV